MSNITMEHAIELIRAGDAYCSGSTRDPYLGTCAIVTNCKSDRVDHVVDVNDEELARLCDASRRRFTHIRQPYGDIVLVDCKYDADRQTVTGIVERGETINRIGPYTSRTEHERGVEHVVNYVSVEEWTSGSKLSVAM